MDIRKLKPQTTAIGRRWAEAAINWRADLNRHGQLTAEMETEFNKLYKDALALDKQERIAQLASASNKGGLQKMSETKKEQSNLPAKSEITKDQAPAGGMFTKYQREAKLLLQSSFLPERFSDPKVPEPRRIADVCVGMELASQFTKFNPLQVMQQIYFVGGQPAWKSSFVVTLLKSEGVKVTFEEIGSFAEDRAKAKTRAIGTDKSGMRYYSTWITWEVVHGNGWDNKAGSKWLSMPDQMARYRAATFLARAYWPELLMGYYTTDERADFTNGEPPEECYFADEPQKPEPAYNPPESIKKCQDYKYEDGPTAEQWQAAKDTLDYGYGPNRYNGD